MRGGGRDWAKNQPLNMATFFDFKIDIHHIFPKKWCEANKIDALRRESIVNKTALSRQTNIRIGGKSPADYLRAIENTASIRPAQLDDILRTHAIDPEPLRAADFDTFFSARIETLLRLVDAAMGKLATRATTEPGDTAENPDAFDLEPPEPEKDVPVLTQAG
jgi:hypothetical protein